MTPYEGNMACDHGARRAQAVALSPVVRAVS